MALPLLSTQDITKSFSGKPLFSGLSLGIQDQERVAIIGSNGAGKSTLLKIISGLESADDGSVVWRRDLRMNYVAQVDSFTPHSTVQSVLEDSLPDHDSAAGSRIARVLGQVGFVDKWQPVEDLSGGWKKRLSIARGLVSEPELLMLDEPTNHLDIEGIEWLEELMRKVRSTLAFISHDRFFIEEVATRVIELDRRYPGGYISCDGNYSTFLEYRSTYLEQMHTYRNRLANKVSREVEWLRQGAKARTTKSKHRTAEAQGLIVELKSINLGEKRTSVEFTSTGKKSKELLRAEGIGKKFEGRELFSNIDLLLSAGSRLGIVGGNGSGKSTLLKVLIGEIPVTSGRVVRPYKVQHAYFDQIREKLNMDDTLHEALLGDAKSLVFGGTEYVAAAWAKRFLFSPEQLSVKLKQLSGGELARVRIAQLMRQPADLLVLDEPTNDLDINTLEILEESLEEFPGAIILVTHDRYLMERVATQVLGLFGDGTSGIYASYLQWEIDKESKPAKTGTPKNADGKATQESSSKSEKSEKTSLTYAERIEFGKMEAKIAKAEADLKTIEERLNDPNIANDPDVLTEACEALASAQEKIDLLYERWQELEKFAT